MITGFNKTIFLQGGYDGTHFLATVEVYDPVTDEWEDGIPLTSGRSGLASAVIYQPSCPQNYSQDCIANISSNREYDDEKKPPDNNDDDADISSKGNRSSYHLNCSSNFFSGRSDSQQHDVELATCSQIKEESSCYLMDVMKEINSRFRDHCANKEPDIIKRNRLQEQYNQGHMLKLARMHLICTNHSPCPLQTLKRRFTSFLSNRKHKKRYEKLYKSNDI